VAALADVACDATEVEVVAVEDDAEVGVPTADSEGNYSKEIFKGRTVHQGT
jgi:hypothetical protein